MDQENITFSKNQDKSYIMTDIHILGYNLLEHSYNYYDIDVDKILLFKKSDEYFVRYNGVNKNKFVLLQIKINNYSFGEIDFKFIW